MDWYKDGSGEIPNLKCGNCKYFKVNADMDGVESTCKRIDHKTVKFAKPYFKSYDCNQFSGIICSDFQPNGHEPDIDKNWTTFEEYWEDYKREWLPYGNTNKYIYFTLGDDNSVEYGVKLLDYIYGNMFDGNKLNAKVKMYMKQDRKSVIGYKLIREEIDGVNIL